MPTPELCRAERFSPLSIEIRGTRLGIVCLLAPHSTAEERMMIAEEYLTRSRLFRRLRNGPHGSHVELYASRLVKVGLNRRGMWRSVNLVGDLLSWLTRISVQSLLAK